MSPRNQIVLGVLMVAGVGGAFFAGRIGTPKTEEKVLAPPAKAGTLDAAFDSVKTEKANVDQAISAKQKATQALEAAKKANDAADVAIQTAQAKLGKTIGDFQGLVGNLVKGLETTLPKPPPEVVKVDKPPVEVVKADPPKVEKKILPKPPARIPVVGQLTCAILRDPTNSLQMSYLTAMGAIARSEHCKWEVINGGTKDADRFSNLIDMKGLPLMVVYDEANPANAHYVGPLPTNGERLQTIIIGIKNVTIGGTP
jgi:hypothetical protein